MIEKSAREGKRAECEANVKMIGDAFSDLEKELRGRSWQNT